MNFQQIVSFFKSLFYKITVLGTYNHMMPSKVYIWTSLTMIHNNYQKDKKSKNLLEKNWKNFDNDICYRNPKTIDRYEKSRIDGLTRMRYWNIAKAFCKKKLDVISSEIWLIDYLYSLFYQKSAFSHSFFSFFVKFNFEILYCWNNYCSWFFRTEVRIWCSRMSLLKRLVPTRYY